MKEITADQPALEMIPVDRELPATPKRKDPKPLRKKRNRSILGWAIVSGIETVIILLQWVAIYLMLPSVF